MEDHSFLTFLAFSERPTGGDGKAQTRRAKISTAAFSVAFAAYASYIGIT
jgi:hypothetical protein